MQTFARYYIRAQAQAGDESAVFTVPNGWAWAMIRGQDSDKKELAAIDFVGKPNVAILTVKATDTNKLKGSIYEVIFGTANVSPSDPMFKAPKQDKKPGEGFDDAKIGMDKDPPPTPLDWSFKPSVSLKQ